ncbi:MAG: Gfo/Idh/MocA family oxidoreductase [Methanobrevibacter thaueri]|nr:Gfo/Idh/MocA family oxidoreductase [Methanobrevibacter thaueri]
MNIGVIGLGSMGKRRIRLIKSNFPDVNIIGIDNSEERCREVEELFNIKTLANSDEFFENNNCNAVFISTPPLTHSKIINDALNNNLSVFTEINLVKDMYDENIDLANENGVTLFLSSTQLYRKEINYITSKISNFNKTTNYIYHIGNYLPDWHPWESYKNFFVGNKKTNGCREILTIELPWIVNAFGEIKQIHVSKNKITDLEVDYPDSFFVNIIHKNGSNGVLIVDLVSRHAVRNLEIINEDGYIQWDGTPEGLKEWNPNSNELDQIKLYDEISNQEDYNQTIIENAYLEEIKDFFNTLDSNQKHGLYSFEKDKYVLDAIDIIEEMDDKKAHVFR